MLYNRKTAAFFLLIYIGEKRRQGYGVQGEVVRLGGRQAVATAMGWVGRRKNVEMEMQRKLCVNKKR